MAKKPNPTSSDEPEGTMQEREEAHLAFLIDLVVSDEQHGIGAELKKVINHPAAQNGDVENLSLEVAKYSEELKLPPRTLAYALIQWFQESDISVSTIKGSANWILQKPYIGFDRGELIAQVEETFQRSLEGLRLSTADPEDCLDNCLTHISKLSKVLTEGKVNLRELKGKKRKLFLPMSKIKLKAFYYSEIRGLNLDFGQIQELLAEAEAPYDLRQMADRKAAQQQIYDWCRSVRQLIASVESDLGS